MVTCVPTKEFRKVKMGAQAIKSSLLENFGNKTRDDCMHRNKNVIMARRETAFEVSMCLFYSIQYCVRLPGSLTNL